MSQEPTEDELRAKLLRLYIRQGNMPAAIAAWQREHGRPLQVSRGFLLEIESEALAIDEAVDACVCRRQPIGIAPGVAQRRRVLSQ
jgi:hypothetical protein